MAQKAMMVIVVMVIAGFKAISLRDGAAGHAACVSLSDSGLQF